MKIRWIVIEERKHLQIIPLPAVQEVPAHARKPTPSEYRYDRSLRRNTHGCRLAGNAKLNGEED